MKPALAKPARVLCFAAYAFPSCQAVLLGEARKWVARRATNTKYRILGVFLSFARLIGRFHMGSDLQRLIVATSSLMWAFIHYSAE
ncbi:hypothetical protein [Rhizobium sp. BK491]|uniref:hypothetical protein n=1 Tax=Rhizobium sp. BK491 TaxID=2587009 RepID=UPI0017D079F3|nr:hypothetical protein [Rhizobium sp. BK491]MBB3567689.1 hypothetical protein [Rhizobium sp. BK491]